VKEQEDIAQNLIFPVCRAVLCQTRSNVFDTATIPPASRVGVRIRVGRNTFFLLRNVPTGSATDSFPGVFSRGVIRPEREVNHSLACSTKVRNEWSYTCAPPKCFLGVDRETFTRYVMLIRAGSVKWPTFQVRNLLTV
jgi:hypothetical protein